MNRDKIDNKTKLFNLILLYISYFRDFDGVKKLNKLLYFTDFEYYNKYSKSITGFNYLKYPMGPVIENYSEIINEMENKKILKRVESRILGINKTYTVHKLKKLVEPDLELFEKEELQVIRDVWYKNELKSGKELEEESHVDAPWVLTEFYQPISYDFVKYRNQELDDYTISEIKAEKSYNRAKVYKSDAEKEFYSSNGYDQIIFREEYNDLNGNSFGISDN
jgi:uncharacterized phage-associated protein